ncbi:MAG: type II toxin-antitoxin system RelE/ParE family toxin [Phenylobacterium sp.]|nr:type II toxin-antitoxin system RelE/ParE family toxin [Phenylobacterium sp.]
MSVYKTKEFSRFARKADLKSADLLDAAKAVASGQWDADLGGGVFKQRIARDGGGKSGGFRTIILFKVGGHSFFVHGFAKNEKANISPKELKALKALAATFLALDLSALETAKSAGEIAEVTIDDEVGRQD